MSLQWDSIKKGLSLTFRFFAPYTPQHNGSIKRSFPTSYGQMRAILNSNKIKGNFRQSLWAETANFKNDTKNIMGNRDNEACPYKRFYGKMPSYSNHLQASRQIGIDKNRNTISGKLNNKGKVCMMLGYATDNTAGTFWLFNLLTRKVFYSINVHWLNIDYNQYILKLSVPNDNNSDDKSDDLAQIDDNSRANQGANDLVSDNENRESNNDKLTEQEGNNGQSKTVSTKLLTQSKVTFANPVMTPDPPSKPPKWLSKELKGLYLSFATNVEGTSLIAEYLMMRIDEAAEMFLALIGGTNTSVDVPDKFQEAWHHPDLVKQGAKPLAKILRTWSNVVYGKITRSWLLGKTEESSAASGFSVSRMTENTGPNSAQLVTRK